MPSTTQFEGLHVAIIMDGNGRWANARGLPRLAGHREGARAVRRTVEAAPDLGVGTLTLYAFSADNWQRPKDEVTGLMRLLERYLLLETAELAQQGVRLNIIGRRDRLDPKLVRIIENAEAMTCGGQRLHLRVAIDYSSRAAIARAAELIEGPASIESMGEAIQHAIGSTPPAPPVDLLVRTSGEQRVSDFLLWEIAYAEFHFTRTPWPEFDRASLSAALSAFDRRERRFGRVNVS